jgi:hypothetical protein
MNSRSADNPRTSPALRFPPSTNASAQTSAVVLATASAPRPAANDDAALAPVNDLHNPLWILAIGMAWFFGAAAAVIALT